MNVAITGANGYLGSRLSSYFSSQGKNVLKLVRNPCEHGELRFDLRAPFLPNTSLRGVDILIHCAYDFGVRNPESIQKVNADGSRYLFSFAQRSGVKHIIYISSVSAICHTKSAYGKAKCQIEVLAKEANCIIVRPAFIISRKPSGMHEKLTKILRNHLLVPCFTRHIPFYITYEKELVYFLFNLCQSPLNLSSDQFNAFSPKPIDFSLFLKEISQSQGFNNIFIPTHPQLILLALKLLELFPIEFNFRSDNFLGLLYSGTIPELESFSNCTDSLFSEYDRNMIK